VLASHRFIRKKGKERTEERGKNVRTGEEKRKHSWRLHKPTKEEEENKGQEKKGLPLIGDWSRTASERKREVRYKN